MKLCVYTIVATILFLSPVLVVHAQTPCGNIVGPKNFVPDLSVQTVTLPIANCDDPFRVTSDPPSPYTLMVNDTEYPGGGTIGVPDGKTNQIRVKGNPELSSYNLLLYKHDGNDYRYVHMDAPEASRADFAEYAATYFESQATANKYMDIYDAFVDNGGADSFFYDENGNQIIDDWTSDPVSDRYSAFADSFYATFVPKRPFIESGTYTLFIKEYLLINTYRTPVQRFVDLIIPTAHAAPLNDAGYPENRYTITFTLTEAVLEPTGASSVLFLPGIMGSRLYEESDACDESENPVVTERQRWISLSECAQLRLVTDFLGNSENEIYTKDKNSSVIDETFGLNLYKTFFSSLSDLKDEGVIENYAVVPYDWRLRLDDLLTASLNGNTGKITLNPSGTVQDGYLYKKLEELVASSTTGKVTIVAHSNGGLLTKALLATLQQTNDPLLDKIDNVILVAVPQVGTPGSVVGMLHGDEIGPRGLVVSQQTARKLMNTMPFAYHLLPNSSYFNGPGVTVESPVIRFASGPITTPWAGTFGETITNVENLLNFMQKESGRTMPAWDDLLTPTVIDSAFFTYTRSVEQLQKNWQPGTSTVVYQIAGVGIETPTTLTYFTDQECAARSPLSLYRCTSYQSKLGYDVDQKIDGDGTVVVPSALAMSSSDENVKRLWLNLDSYNRSGVLGSNINRVHKDILEVPELMNFIRETIQGTSTLSYEYLSTTSPQFTETDRMTFSLHSPLDMSLELPNGKIISSSTPYVDGAVYRRYGELQYISVPGSGAKKKLKLTGQSTGSFTLEARQIKGGNVAKQSYVAIPSATSTLVTGDFTDATSLAKLVLTIDYDGNGTTDINYSVNGEVVTYAQLREYVAALNLKVIYKKVLLETIKIAEQNYVKSQTKSQLKKIEKLTLELLKQQVILYVRLRLISASDQQSLLDLINKLNN